MKIGARALHFASHHCMSSRKRGREENGGEPKPKRKRKAAKDLTGLQRFRRQTLDRRTALRKIIRENNKELRAILRDLGKLKRK